MTCRSSDLYMQPRLLSGSRVLKNWRKREKSRMATDKIIQRALKLIEPILVLRTKFFLKIRVLVNCSAERGMQEGRSKTNAS
jgi:hypothetical protein